RRREEEPVTHVTARSNYPQPSRDVLRNADNRLINFSPQLRLRRTNRAVPRLKANRVSGGRSRSQFIPKRSRGVFGKLLGCKRQVSESGPAWRIFLETQALSGMANPGRRLVGSSQRFAIDEMRRFPLL